VLLADITTSITNFVTSLYVHTGLVGILLAMAIESCCIPLPSEIVMPLAGVMLVTGKILSGIGLLPGLILVALAGSLGCVIGSIAAYGIGYAGGRPLMLKYGRYVLISHHDADRADAFFQKYGSATAFFSRLLPVVRTYISLPAGITKMPFVKFIMYSFLGSFPWCLLLAYVGTLIGNNLARLSPIFHGLDIVIIVVVVVLVALYIRRHIRNDRAARAMYAAGEAEKVASQQAMSQNGWGRQPSPQQGWGQQPPPPQQQSLQQPSQQQQGWGQQKPQQLPQQQGWDGQPIEPPQQGWGQPVLPQLPQPQQSFQQQGWGRTQSPSQEQWPSPNGHNGQNGQWR
jgi:membrane protein DedA with SNARE-associated domain